MTSIMDSPQSHIGRNPGVAPGTERERTAELLTELAGCETDKAAVQMALERASDAVDAELCVYVDGNLTESATSNPALVAPVFGRLRGHLILTRAGRAFDDGERDRIEPIATALSLFEPGAGPEPLLDRLALQAELAQALEEGQIQAHYLPKVDLRSARVTGVEALARWLHPDRGELVAGEFMDLAEAGGLMPALTERIVEAVDSGNGRLVALRPATPAFGEPARQRSHRTRPGPRRVRLRRAARAGDFPPTHSASRSPRTRSCPHRTRPRRSSGSSASVSRSRSTTSALATPRWAS